VSVAFAIPIVTLSTPEVPRSRNLLVPDEGNLTIIPVPDAPEGMTVPKVLAVLVLPADEAELVMDDAPTERRSRIAVVALAALALASTTICFTATEVEPLVMR
jgi:hypothetical protein